MPPKMPQKGGAKAREAAAESKNSGDKVGAGRSRSTAKCEGPARNENSAVNSAADVNATSLDKKASAGARKMVATGASKSGLRNVPEYDALEYIEPLPENSQRPATAHHSIIFDDASEDR